MSSKLFYYFGDISYVKDIDASAKMSLIDTNLYINVLNYEIPLGNFIDVNFDSYRIEDNNGNSTAICYVDKNN